MLLPLRINGFEVVQHSCDDQMNEGVGVLTLREFMDRPEGWGRVQGRDVYQRLLRSVEENPGTLVFIFYMNCVVLV